MSNETRVSLASEISAKLVTCVEHIRALKLELGDLQIAYERHKNQIMGALAEIDSRATMIVCEAAIDAKLDPMKTSVDWKTFELIAPL